MYTRVEDIPWVLVWSTPWIGTLGGTRVRYPRGCRNSPLGYTPVGTP
nr:MAG TPA: translation initiation factor-like protein [Caudoviricetes sp.]